jgi:hypothetical protein
MVTSVLLLIVMRPGSCRGFSPPEASAIDDVLGLAGG